MMLDEAVFLLARIAEDEAAAFGTSTNGYATAAVGDGIGVTVGGRRLRAECEAKRRIVEDWDRRWDEAEAAANDVSRTVPERNSLHAMFASQATGLGTAVRHIATLYADHPDFDPEWLC